MFFSIYTSLDPSRWLEPKRVLIMIRMIVRCRYAAEYLNIWRNSNGAVRAVNDLWCRLRAFLQSKHRRIQTKDLMLQSVNIMICIIG